MLKPKVNCTVCQAIGLDPLLKDRIYGSKYYAGGKESLSSIVKAYSPTFSLDALSNHCKKHQLGDTHVTKSVKLANLRASMNTESKVVDQLASSGRITDIPKDNYEQLWDTIITLGAERILKGEIKVNGAMVLKAARDKSDYQSHRKDNQLEVAKMMYNFASGEQTDLEEIKEMREANATTVVLTESRDGGTDQPDGVHRTVAGDEAASGAAEVSGRDAAPQNAYQFADVLE